MTHVLTIHDIGPDYVKLYYHTNTHNHVMQFSVRPGDNPPETVHTHVSPQVGGPMLTSVAIATLVAVLVSVTPNTGGYDYWERFYKSTPQSDPIVVASEPVINGAGTSTGVSHTAEQLSMTFRTTLGGRYMLRLMELAYPVDTVYNAPSFNGDAPLQALSAFLLGNDSFILGRDGGTPIACHKAITKTNDALRKAYLI